MSDFKQLALEFVLTDNQASQSRIAGDAAGLIKSSPPNSLPVARWVESIRPWMPGSENSEMLDIGDSGSKGDIIARAKALQFLASTLQCLDKNVLIPAHIKLLVAFFGAMFSVDHKAGILPSAQALTTISSMRAFRAEHGSEIIGNVCAMGDDFPKQVAETRLAIFDLFYELVTDPKVSDDLRKRHSDCDFMVQMLDIFSNERDPKNLIRWFSILGVFLTKYEPSAELTEQIFGAYAAYFPISLRTSKHPSGITPDDLKVSLRGCFAADDRVASHAIPFLIQKLNQGEGVSVDVKLDILRTIKACVVGYNDPQSSVTPFVDRIWNCLKYEVRNGEVDETINSTLETLRAMAARLESDALRDFILTVLRECLDDLSNPTYAAQAGKLLVCTASATVGAFVLVLSPAAKQVMEDLRKTRSRDHKCDLLAFLNAILQVRSLFTGGEEDLSEEARAGMESTEPVLHSLFDLAYKPCLQSPDMVVSRKAVEGLGLLVGQSSSASREQRLLDEATCTAISSNLIERLVNPTDDLVDEVVIALQKVVMAWPPAFATLVERSLGASTVTDNGSVEDLTALTSRLAFISCSEVPRKPADAFSYFTGLTLRLCLNLSILLEKPHTPRDTLVVYPAALQSAMRYFKDALDEKLQADSSKLEFPADVAYETWTEYISTRYPLLKQIGKSSPHVEEANAGIQSPYTILEPTEVYNDYFLVCLFITRWLYHRSTSFSKGDDNGSLPAVTLSDEVSQSGGGNWRGQHLHLTSFLATFTISQLSQSQQSRLMLHEEVVTLFRGSETISSGDRPRLRDALLKSSQPSCVYESKDINDVPAQSSLKQRFPISLSLGILQPLHPKVVGSLFESGFGKEYIVSKFLAVADRPVDPQLGYFLLILANKFKIEGIPKALSLAEQQISAIVEGKDVLGPDGQPQSVSSDMRLSLAKNIYALVAGALRRYTGSSLAQIFSSLLQGPANAEYGHVLARDFDILFRPHSCLRKDLNASLKPLWSQKAYINLVKPMLPLAWPKRQGSDFTCANYSIAVLSSVRHMDYGVYADDAQDLIRLVLCVLRNLPAGADVEAGLRVLETVATESSEVLEPFLKSIIDACEAIVAGSDAPDVSFIPGGYPPAGPKVQAKCRDLAVMLLGYLPGRFEHGKLRAAAPKVGRLLAVACGDGVRRVRRAALTAKVAWADVN